MATRITKKLVFLPGRCNIPPKIRVFSKSSSSFSSPSDYLQTISHVPTMLFQPALPQLPIPTLQDTCQRVLSTAHSVLCPEELKEKKAMFEEFQRGEGHNLNIELEEQNKKNSHTNYVADAWMDMYLMSRLSVLNTNVAAIFSEDSRPAYMHQILRATNITVSLLRFVKSLRNEKLVPSVFHKNPSLTDTEEFWRSIGSLSSHEAYRHAVKSNVYPLDMSQFHRLFNATRIPKPTRDELFCDVTKRHVLVMCRGHMYVFDVLEEDGSIVSGQNIQGNLQFILTHSAASPPHEHPLGFLTTQDRDTWTHLRHKIVELSKDNQSNMTLIDSALFCLCLDDDPNKDNHEGLLKRGLYGNAGNRWFDKTIQFIITKAGSLLLNLEHSPVDGITSTRLMSEAFQDSVDRPAVSPGDTMSNADYSQTVKKLEFNLDSVTRQGIEDAQVDHIQTNQLNVRCMDYKRYGSTFLKECRLSPDAIAQLAMQIAFHRVNGFIPIIFEHCNTALYKHGRMEMIYSATSETKSCAEAFNGRISVSPAEKVSLINACSDKHRQLTAQARAGQGWDCHLFALEALASKSGKSISLFQDIAFANAVTLSTSTTGVHVGYNGAALPPDSPNGLGIGYSIMEDGFQWRSTSYKTSQSLSDFLECLQQASDEIHEVLRYADSKLLIMNVAQSVKQSGSSKALH